MMKKMMIILVAVAFACSSAFLLASCAKKEVKVEEMAKPAEVKPPAAPPKVQMGESEEYKQREAERLAKLHELEMEQKLRDEMGKFESERIYFDFDKSELKPEARAILTKKAEWLRKNPQFSVKIEGNCDERGTNEYNLALGERRANAAMKFLNALGVSANRISTISYGEERPADPRHNEEAWAKNRRDEFKLME
jgi:peptidoglycan-associated lipoprotein